MDIDTKISPKSCSMQGLRTYAKLSSIQAPIPVDLSAPEGAT